MACRIERCNERKDVHLKGSKAAASLLGFVFGIHLSFAAAGIWRLFGSYLHLGYILGQLWLYIDLGPFSRLWVSGKRNWVEKVCYYIVIILVLGPSIAGERRAGYQDGEHWEESCSTIVLVWFSGARGRFIGGQLQHRLESSFLFDLHGSA